MNLLVTGAFDIRENELNILKNSGFDVLFMQFEKDELPCDASWVEGVVANGLFLTHPIENFKNLKFIQLTSAGYDRVPMDYVAEHGIKIFNAGGVYSVPMAEFAICGVLNLYKQMKSFLKNQENSLWQKNRTLLELYQKSVCIVGCGSVGTECAKRFRAFGCKVTGVDLISFTSEFYDKTYLTDDLDLALESADIVVLTLPLTDKTRGLFGKEKFDKMKDGSVLVNISRGAVVDQSALETALKGKLCGAVSDVFEEEPLSPESPLWNMENAIITPHNSFVGEGNHDRLFEVIVKNLKQEMDFDACK